MRIVDLDGVNASGGERVYLVLEDRHDRPRKVLRGSSYTLRLTSTSSHIRRLSRYGLGRATLIGRRESTDREARVVGQHLGVAALDWRGDGVPVFSVAPGAGKAPGKAPRDVGDHADVGKATPLAVAHDVDAGGFLERDRERHCLVEQAFALDVSDLTLVELVEELLQDHCGRGIEPTTVVGKSAGPR